MNCCSQTLFPWAVCLLVLLVLPPRFDSDSAGPRDDRRVVARRPLLRSKRNSCQDGTGTVNGKTCCRCAAGQFLIKQCENTAEDRECDFCNPGTFNSHANLKSSCELCTSCTHPSDNLEVREACTIGKDTVCGCKEGYYLDSPPSTACHPCDTCEGKVVKTPCRGTNNTVCEEKNQGHTAVVTGSVVGVMLIALLVSVVACWKKRLLCFRRSWRPVADPEEHANAKEMVELGRSRGPVAGPEEHANAKEMEELLKDLYRHVPDVAEAVGWTEMRDIALATGSTAVTIENCRRDYPADVREQTVQLLLLWMEAQGSRASVVLVEKLRARHRNAMAERVLAILQKDDMVISGPIPIISN